MKKLLVLSVFILIFSIPVCAQQAGKSYPDKSEYKKQYEASGAGNIEKSLPADIRSFFSSEGINPEDEKWVNKITPEGVFRHILKFLKTGAKAPIAAGCVITGIILASAAFPAVSADGKVFAVARCAAALSAALTVSYPVLQCVNAAVSAIQGCGTFMLSFIPVFAAIVSVSGGAVTAVSMSALLLGAAEAVNTAAAFAVLPMMGSYLAMSLTAGVSPLTSGSGIAEGIRRAALWILSLISTVFIGILSIQTAVNSSADSLTVKTAKFILGSSVPMAGAALSEAASAVSSSLGLLRSSLGIYGVAAISAILLPILAEALLWRLMLMFSSMAAEVLGEAALTKILKAVDMMLSLLISLILLVGAMFIISLCVVVSAGKAL